MGPETNAETPDRPAASTAATALGVVGLVLYAATGFFYIASGLMVPGGWLIALWVVWLAGIYPLVTVFRRWRPWTSLVAAGALAFWWVYITVGEALLDWTG